MTEDAEMIFDLSKASVSEQQAPHFLRDVIFHGKFKVSFFTYKRNRQNQNEAVNEYSDDIECMKFSHTNTERILSF